MTSPRPRRRWSAGAASRCGGRSPTRFALPSAAAISPTGCRPKRRSQRASASTAIRCAAPLPHWSRKACCAPSRGAAPSSRRASASPIRSDRARDFRKGWQGQARERRGMLLGSLRRAGRRARGRRAEACPKAPMSFAWRPSARPTAGGFRAPPAISTLARFAGIDKVYAASGSITAAFREFGVDDYFRRSTMVSARHAGAGGSRRSQACRRAPSCSSRVYVNVDPDGLPVQFSETRFAADWSSCRSAEELPRRSACSTVSRILELARRAWRAANGPAPNGPTPPNWARPLEISEKISQ